ncbi:NtaA/DmoA family FMN-dependent monooxygenase [Paenarthrobacter sp. NPDC089316]|uniref:NtaA/DmoA family FMN-dependent monooxygenase n=1 Tax=unclassified Paenarthrobacter TaxID=2634190 RepID=UPI00344549F5
MARRKQLIIATSSWPIGRHASAWRLPEALIPHPVDPTYLADTAAAAERGLFDYFFVGNAISSEPSRERTWTNDVFKAEGFALGAFVAARTSHVGIVVTTNTTYADPYDTARSAVTLEHLSGGRLGLNLVLGLAGIDLPAANYGRMAHPERDTRYERAEEFTTILRDLQHSWDKDWFVGDRQSGRLYNSDAFHPIHFAGTHLSVDGALNVPPPIQPEIPLIHAGTSPQSLAFGASHAAVRFSPYFGTEYNSDYYRAVQQSSIDAGRDPDDVAVLPGITFYVGGTTTEARAKFREVQQLVMAEYAPAAVSQAVGQDVTGVSPGERAADVLSDDTLHTSPWLQTAFDAFGGHDVTLEDLFRYTANAGHLNQNSVVGDGRYVADWIAERFEGRVLDGVKVFPPYSRTPLDAFVDLVVPELQALGLHRTEYAGTTLTEHLRQSR